MFESMWNKFSVRLSRSPESATEVISLALYSVLHALIFFFQKLQELESLRISRKTINVTNIIC